MAGILQRPAPAIVAFLAGAGLQLSGIEDFRFALGLWSFAALWSLLAVVSWEPVRTRMPKLPYTISIQKKTERQEISHADLNIVPLAVDGTAMLRVDNEGPQVDVSASVQRIEDWELKTIPYRLVWQPKGSAKQPYNITQKVLPLGRVDFALVAESPESKGGRICAATLGAQRRAPRPEHLMNRDPAADDPLPSRYALRDTPSAAKGMSASEAVRLGW